MAAYSYRALHPTGKTIRGVLEGDSERQVRNQLRGQQLKPLVVTAAKSSAVNVSHWWPKYWYGLGVNVSWTRSIGRRDLSVLTRQLASLVASGMPLDEALSACAQQARKAHIKTILLQVRTKVQEGLSLAQALQQSPTSFDAMYRALVHAGEISGFLGQVLERLAEYCETSQATRQRLSVAMIYPLVLLLVSVSVVAILMIFVVPKLVSIFDHSHRQLPWLTEVLISSSQFLSSYSGIMLTAVLVLSLALRKVLSIDRYRLRWHKLLLTLPLIRHVIIQADSARFASTLGLLLDSGVSLVEAINISVQSMANDHLRQRTQQLVISVAEGGSLARSMEQIDDMPPLLIQMVASGERNGELARQLNYAANNQERELKTLMAAIGGLLEPLTVVVMGGLVAIIVMAILLPIFDLNTLV
ncbi:GspF family T2SS innner membrane protein variant XcpS [Maricurvus nonylphenolicus]|uniref:type II secretion system inner membrane protein GspF n=1 Tax=Maricurvus nonylphenolicus TaxID=1008307 RepID=UPI0036F2B2FB